MQLDEAARLAACARRMYAPGGGDMHDALDLIKLSSGVYHYARWHNVLQAVRAGATDGQIAIALGMSIPDTRDLIDRIRARPRALAGPVGFVTAVPLIEGLRSSNPATVPSEASQDRTAVLHPPSAV